MTTKKMSMNTHIFWNYMQKLNKHSVKVMGRICRYMMMMMQMMFGVSCPFNIIYVIFRRWKDDNEKLGVIRCHTVIR